MHGYETAETRADLFEFLLDQYRLARRLELAERMERVVRNGIPVERAWARERTELAALAEAIAGYRAAWERLT